VGCFEPILGFDFPFNIRRVITPSSWSLVLCNMVDMMLISSRNLLAEPSSWSHFDTGPQLWSKLRLWVCFSIRLLVCSHIVSLYIPPSSSTYLTASIIVAHDDDCTAGDHYLHSCACRGRPISFRSCSLYIPTPPVVFCSHCSACYHLPHTHDLIPQIHHRPSIPLITHPSDSVSR